MPETGTDDVSTSCTDSPVHAVIQNKIHRTKDSYRDNHRARKLRLYVNGDRFFRGKTVYLTANRHYKFNDFLDDITGKLPPNENLPYGVRQVFTPQRGRRINDVDDLTDGQTYVCAGFEGFKTIKYGRPEPQHWSVAISQLLPMTDHEPESPSRYRYHGPANAFPPGRYFRANQSHPQRRFPDKFVTNQRRVLGASFGDNLKRPKAITVIKTGGKPRGSIKILLNHGSNQSYEQLIADISGAFGPKSKDNPIRKLFTARGKEVMGLSDFFRGGDLFVAVGDGDSELTESEIWEILVEFFPDTVDLKALLAEWKKNERKRRKIGPFNHFAKSNKDGHVVNQINSNPVPDKRDSGFDSAEVSTNRSEPDQGDLHVATPHRKVDLEKVSFRRHNKQGLVDSQIETRRSYEFPALKKVRESRLAEENEENEKLNWWRKHITEADRRIRIVDRRKKMLVPLRNIDTRPKIGGVSRVSEIQENPVVRREEVVEEGQRIDLDTVSNDSRRDDALIEEVNMAETVKGETDDQVSKEDNTTCFHATAVEDDKHIVNVDKTKDKKSENLVRQKSHSTEAVALSNNVPERAQNNEGVAVSIETAPKSKLLPVDALHLSTAVSGQQEAKDKSNQQQKEKRKQEREDQQQRKRAKTKIVRKTKLERQVSSDEYVVTRFELGRKLGDGNFAIVRQSRKIETGQEFAVKVIDKAKLKGKENMVENEIDILKDCCHQNIVQLYEEYETSHRIYLVMELVKGGDLFDSITQNVKFPETDSSMMIKDVCNALFYLHSRSIVHRDLKPENLLVHRSKDGTINLKLADFGLAMEVTAPIYTVCGTPTYVAPEILADKGYGLEVDMWAVGVITYILLCGFPPFRSPDRNQTELFEFIKAGYFEFLSPYWDNMSIHAKDLISHLLVVDRKRRYNAVDVLSHKWVVCHGQTDVLPDGAVSIDGAARETRRELEVQAKLNYESYQRLKRRKKQEQERQEE